MSGLLADRLTKSSLAAGLQAVKPQTARCSLIVARQPGRPRHLARQGLARYSPLASCAALLLRMTRSTAVFCSGLWA